MTEKTINCENCSREYTFEENPKFPRKYCDVCSAMKKAQFEGGTNGDAKPKMVYAANGELVPEVVKIDHNFGQGKPKDNGFHLTPEQVRSNALKSAIECTNWQNPEDKIPMLIETAKEFEQYILTGE